jgi:hypothetical protein
MNKKTEIALMMGLSLIAPAALTLIAFIGSSVSGGTEADMQMLLCFSIAMVISGVGIVLLVLEVIELRSFIEEGLKIHEKTKASD